MNKDLFWSELLCIAQKSLDPSLSFPLMHFIAKLIIRKYSSSFEWCSGLFLHKSCCQVIGNLAISACLISISYCHFSRWILFFLVLIHWEYTLLNHYQSNFNLLFLSWKKKKFSADYLFLLLPYFGFWYITDNANKFQFLYFVGSCFISNILIFFIFFSNFLRHMKPHCNSFIP